MNKKYLLVTILMMIFVNIVDAQVMKVKSPCSDLKVKVVKCEESGNDVLVTLLLENIGSKDVDFSLCGGYDNYSVAIDDEGNKFSVENIKVKIGNNYYNQMFVYDKLYSEVPVKATVKISDVPEHATSFSLLSVWFNSNDWGVYGTPIKITNLPISREGDE